jgi:BCCT family betaine/carnitine transporter
MAPTVDKRVLWPSLAVTTGVALLLICNPESGEQALRVAFAGVTHHFGWLLALFGLAALVFLLWLALGRYGQVRLGDRDEPPEFSTVSWVAMMFTAGVGIGLMNWSFVEPIYYLNAPPFGVEPRSALAVEWASVYGAFHWGPIGWAI